MIADIAISEKSFGPKVLMTNVHITVDDREKVGLIGRNGIGKSTLFNILTGSDSDYSGAITYKRGTTVVATAQEHHDIGDITVLQYILSGVPHYARLSHIIDTYPLTMGDNMAKIHDYTQALDQFTDKGFYTIETTVEQELANFQLQGVAHTPFAALSGGQKRLIEVVKIMHSRADMALIDEPTNHMDYVAKRQFIEWMTTAPEAMVIVTHDRDVLRQVNRIIELKDGAAVSYQGNYDTYLKQNAHATGTAIHEYELTERRMANLRVKIVQFRRLKEKARDPDTIKQFKRREQQAAAELAALTELEKPTFWIDKDSVAALGFKAAGKYDKYKSRTIRMTLRSHSTRSSRVLVRAADLALGYGDTLLFEGVQLDLREHEAIELRGRNGAGKTTLIKALLAQSVHDNAPSPTMNERHKDRDPIMRVPSGMTVFDGTLQLDPHVTIGVYEQEISGRYLDTPLAEAIEKLYLDNQLSIGHTKIRQLMADYLFTENDGALPLRQLSGGQKARFQLIAMLAADPQLLILDEPTNHLDLPSIEELESALARYSGAILYVSHDGYFRSALGGTVVTIGK
jgi:ATP-binding cassette subfamily F protein 3